MRSATNILQKSCEGFENAKIKVWGIAARLKK